MSLTDATIKALKPKDRPYKVSDGGGESDAVADQFSYDQWNETRTNYEQSK
ncbi:MAG: Arm DNA-binding domain-containing protein [Desulfovibrio sp.]|jgi:hypothetical protein|nr:Arm DNA-binding domain-containing protein [Desulfovibrio sp.]